MRSPYERKRPFYVILLSVLVTGFVFLAVTREDSRSVSLPSLIAAQPDSTRSPDTASDPEVTRGEILKHIKFFSADAMKGREAGSEGARKAADYIADHFEKLGLIPAGDKNTYFQNFEIPRGFKVLKTSSFKVVKGKRTSRFPLGKDFSLFSTSAPGSVDAEAIFLGYGIAAADLNYDDYEDVDVTGKVVVVLRGAPRQHDSKSPFGNADAMRRYGSLEAKLETATGAGAAALVVMNDPASVKKTRKDKLDGDPGKTSGKIPFVHLTAKSGSRLLSMGKMRLSSAQSIIDKTMKPLVRPIKDVKIRINADLEKKVLKVRNVAGLLLATGEEKTDEVLVVGAHFDHVGLGEFGSRGGSKALGKVHNGADDNASGTAGLLEIAAFLPPHAWELRRDVLFLSFAAEEMGLLGSKHYVKEPLVPLSRTAAMVNLDMVGRLKRQELFVGGVGTSPVFPKILTEQNRKVRVPLQFGEGGIAPTDSATFYRKRIPVLFFFTGLHKDYHLPGDDWNKIDAGGEEKIVRLAAEVSLELGRRKSRPPFKEAETGGFDTGGPSLGLGIEQKDEGVFVATVARKSVAGKAGVRAGDKVVELKGSQVFTASDFMSIQSSLKAGEKVEMAVRRKGRLRTVRFLVK